MPDQTPPDLPEVDSFRFWRPEYQAKAVELLRERETTDWRPFYCHNPACDGHPHDNWAFEHARADQRPPTWSAPWLVWLLAGGRGSGKTRTGSEVTHRVSNRVPRIILIAPTGPDLRSTMVEGISGILACSPPGKRPLWEPSKKRLTWPNGCIAEGYSAEEPDRLRGPNSGFVWGDEPAHWPLVDQVWDNMLFGLRVGQDPKIIATSTPKPIKWMKNLIADPKTVVHRVSTYANLANLAPTFRDNVIDRYEGTRLGRQELHGEVLEDVEGSLWDWDMIRWIDEVPDLRRVVVGIDPAGTANRRSDETGIIVLAADYSGNYYVLADYTGRYSPAEWARRANAAYDEFDADCIVAEKNYGGDMVRHTLESAGHSDARIKLVTSRRGKALRAEPIVALYEKKRFYHAGVRGDLAALEEELTTWVPGHGDSPNRVDALVHAAHDLVRGVAPSHFSNPNQVLAGLTSPHNRHLRVV